MEGLPGNDRPRIAGVIAEYNPFHRGHAYHLRHTREACNADYLVVCMSTCFTQRGEPALLPVRRRVQMALSCGADAVIALPALWSLRESEAFALGGVSLLDAVGCAYLSFGAETGDVALLQETASLLEAPPQDMTLSMKKALSLGMSFPQAQCRAMEQVFPEGAQILRQPNNILAVAYLRQMLRLHTAMQPFAVARTSSYLSTQITDASLPSASAVRAAIWQGNWNAISASLPEACMDILLKASENGELIDLPSFDPLVLHRIRSLSKSDLASLPDQDGGLPDRLYAAARRATSFSDLVEQTITRRYTAARVRRLIWQTVLGWTKEDLPHRTPESILLLGIREDAMPLFSILSQARMPVITRARDLIRPDDRHEAQAWDLWALGARKPSGELFRHGIVRV